MNVSGTIAAVRSRINELIFVKLFPFWESLGFHISRVHFYEPIPDARTLKADLWLEDSEHKGIDLNEDRQLALLSLFSSKFKNEYDTFPKTRTSTPYEYYLDNGKFGGVDAEILYCMVRHLKPRRIFEIGCGNSTYLYAQAILKNRKEDEPGCELVAFEPYPSDVLRAGFPGLSKLVTKRIQDVDLDRFDELRENDILSIDSTHVLSIGSDVHYEYLKLLPSLDKGVVVQVHDIFLPAEYPSQWVLERHRFWTEQYMLQAFLIFNDAFKILWGSHFMHRKHPSRLEAAFSSYERERTLPASFWMRKVR